AGEAAMKLRACDADAADRGIDEQRAVAAEALDDDEVIHVPVQNDRSFEMAKIVRLASHSIDFESKVRRSIGEAPRRRATTRDAAMFTDFAERHVAPERSKHH